MDISKEAAAVGFEVPVYVSRLVQESVIFARSPCACPSCEQGAMNLMMDRRERILIGLRAAIEALPGEASEVAFAIDVKLKSSPAEKHASRPVHRRKYWPLRAVFGPPEAAQPVILILGAHEVHEHSIWAPFMEPRHPSCVAEGVLRYDPGLSGADER